MKNLFKKSILVIMSIVVIFCFVSCNNEDTTSNNENSQATTSSKDENLPAVWSNAKYTADTELGKGEKTIKVEVKAENKSILFTVHTDKSTLADALIELKLISGDDSEYGIFIKEVNGITADYDVDKSFWAITKDGTSLAVGADSTNIADNEHYEFTYTKE